MSELAINSEQLPVFTATEYEDHVNSWLDVDRDMQDCYWKLAAVAASLVSKYGEDVMGKFGSDVGSSKRRIQEYARTYREWEKRERSRILSFHHHTLAIKADDPQKAIEAAEDEQLSTRELEAFVKTGELPNREEIAETKEVENVEEPSPYEVVEITRIVKVDIIATAKYSDDTTHDLDREALLKRGWKPEINITWRKVESRRGSSPKESRKNGENQR